jgi:hypothetical protein
VAALVLLLAAASTATAGMPAPLPTNPERVLRLSDSGAARLQAVSFFLAVFLLCAAVVWGLWNFLRRDFPSLPRLSFGRAVGVVLLWGLLFVVVLTMISGARELMTPGAWKKQNFTYRPAGDPDTRPEPDPEGGRRRHLEELRTALWQFAATHNGRFPNSDEVSAIPARLWEVPGAGGMRYLYAPGKSAGHLPEVLAYEPELDPDRRLVLRTNGDILVMRSEEVRP